MGHPVQIFFSLMNKIFLRSVVELILRDHKFFILKFWDPLGPPYEQNENFCMWGVEKCIFSKTLIFPRLLWSNYINNSRLFLNFFFSSCPCLWYWTAHILEKMKILDKSQKNCYWSWNFWHRIFISSDKKENLQ